MTSTAHIVTLRLQGDGSAEAASDGDGDGDDDASDDGAFTMEVHLPPDMPASGIDTHGGSTPRPAMIVCPGGSYKWLNIKIEGTPAAEWLLSLGYVVARNHGPPLARAPEHIRPFLLLQRHLFTHMYSDGHFRLRHLYPHTYTPVQCRHAI